MKMLSAFFLSIAATSAFAATVVEPVHTGTPLDVAKTISVTDTSAACGVVPVKLVYDDSHGVRHIASYLVLGNGCAGG